MILQRIGRSAAAALSLATRLLAIHPGVTMRQRERDARFVRFIHRHVQGCGGVSVEHQESLIPGLTLRVTCHCGVSAEWWIPPPLAEADADAGHGPHLLSA